MNFAAPNYAYVLFLLPLVALFKIWADGRARRSIAAFASSERLRTSLLGGAAPIWSGIHFGLQLLGLTFMILALTRPQLGTTEREIEQTGRNILIAMDTSKSMLASDIKPNRLTRAKLAAQDLLEKLPGDRVGVIAFAGRAFLQAPLTTDHDAVIESIQSLDHTTIPRGGSSLSAAINLALETMEKANGKQHGMIIFTDGQETDAATMEAVKQAVEKNLLILTVGVGTAAGEVIPDPDPESRGDYIRDESGNVVNSKLDSSMLREVARQTGGEYVELGSQALTQSLVNKLLANLDLQKSDSRQDIKPIERYQWPLGAGIFMIALSLFMRPSSRKRVKTSSALPVDPKATVHQAPTFTRATLLTFGLISLSTSAFAAVNKDLSVAINAYNDGQYETSRDAYSSMLNDEKPPVAREELAYGLGAATLKLKDYDRATNAFSQALESSNVDVQQRALRGLGTSLYNRGDEILKKAPETALKAWGDALSHLEEALKFSPDDTELKENRDFIKNRIQQVKQEQEEKQKQQGKDKKKDKQQGDGEGEGDPQDGEGGGEPKDKDQQNGENGDKEGEKQKQHDAMQEKKDGEGQLPEGELSAGEAGKPDDKQMAGTPKEAAEDKKNEKTGFSPMEARSQLRNYADDQNSVQYLMRREQAPQGKDY